ncbi:hypothetical protein [Duganella sp. HH105]|uniref:hypothetical protein n=1 Tax=Duganella sp. HH105 TaxID=1781067 RepID=UPI00114CB016|nr:hypothetical protein [Duganella sp. HH105]
MRKLIAGIVTLFSINSTMADSESQSPPKQINYRGGLVVFSLPGAWTEEYEPEAGGLFYAPGDDTGTLRLDVITAKSPNPVTSADSSAVLLKIGNSHVETLPTGAAIAKRISREVDRGNPITTYWWSVASAAEPDLVRIASFSYSILSSQEQSEHTALDLSFLEQSIRDIRFSSILGK